MNELFIYMLKVSAGLGIIFLPYYLLFRNDPNLVVKRFYLLAGLVAAWIFPLITFRRPEMIVNLTPMVFIDPNSPEVQPAIFDSSVSSPGITINWIQLLIITYLTGLVFMFLKNLFIVFKWNHTWQKTKNDEGVAFHKSDQVFTLFTRVFIPSTLKNEQDINTVLLHEKAHIHQLHFIDLMLMEFTLLLTWFNPFSWLISRMIKENHEHLADRQVLSAGVNPARYRAQLLNHTLGVNVFRLGNQFNHSLTLKRFNMMKKPRKSPTGIIKIALLIPAILITLGLTTGMTPQQKVIKGKVVFADTGESPQGASVIIEGTTVGTITDAEGEFILEVDGNPNIVISFVGYSTLKIKSSAIKKKPLKLEPKVFEVDLESVPMKVHKEDEITINDIEESRHKGDEVFYIVEEMPMFPGGKGALKTYIYSNLEYPTPALKNGINGEVYVQFQVAHSGKLKNIKIVRSTHQSFNKPALEVFEGMPDWNPGTQRGKPVQVQVVVPVRFDADME